jgi:hypothetical protein
MEIRLTAGFRKFPQGYAAFVQELPGANTQGCNVGGSAGKFEGSGRDGFAGESRISFNLNERDHRNPGSD